MPSRSSSWAKRFHCGVNSVPPAKMPGDAGVLQARPVRLQSIGQRLEQLGRGEQALDVVTGRQHRDRLVDHVVLIGLEVLHPALLDELDHPPGIQVHAEADAAPVLGQMLDGQPQPPGAARPQHEPVAPPGKVLVGQGVGEELVVGAKILLGHPALGDPGGSAGLEHERRTIRVGLGHPAADRPAPQLLVLEVRELRQIVEALDLTARIPPRLPRPVEPERAPGVGIEVPLDDLPHPGIEGSPGLGGPGLSSTILRSHEPMILHQESAP